jgi:Na+/H+ antiporter NhaD/arsenite permease-like protein
MMIVVAHLKVSGAFRALGAFAVEHAHAPLALLIATTALADAHRLWLVVAMSSTLAGNFTLIGSVANLIVA